MSNPNLKPVPVTPLVPGGPLPYAPAPAIVNPLRPVPVTPLVPGGALPTTNPTEGR